MGLDYAAMIADLETKKVAIENSIVSLRLAAGSELGNRTAEIPPSNPPVSGGPFDLPVGVFLNISIPAAIKLYLSSVKRKQTVKEITAALKAGGMESASENFENTVSTALHRMKLSDPPEVLRFPDGWGLAELYPESLRNRMSVAPRPQKAKRKKRVAKKKANGLKSSVPLGDRPESKLEQFFGTREGDFSGHEIASALAMTTQTVGLLASKLIIRGVVEKTPEGKYRSVKIQQMPKAG